MPIQPTHIGNFVRKLRLLPEYNHTLKDMAEILNYSSALLSGIELGKKEIPSVAHFIDTISSHYKVDKVTLRVLIETPKDQDVFQNSEMLDIYERANKLLGHMVDLPKLNEHVVTSAEELSQRLVNVLPDTRPKEHAYCDSARSILSHLFSMIESPVAIDALQILKKNTNKKMQLQDLQEIHQCLVLINQSERLPTATLIQTRQTEMRIQSIIEQFQSN